MTKLISDKGFKLVDNPLDGAEVAANQADSTADTVAKVVTDFNALLKKLKDAGLMEADAES